MQGDAGRCRDGAHEDGRDHAAVPHLPISPSWLPISPSCLPISRYISLHLAVSPAHEDGRDEAIDHDIRDEVVEERPG